MGQHGLLTPLPDIPDNLNTKLLFGLSSNSHLNICDVYFPHTEDKNEDFLHLKKDTLQNAHTCLLIHNFILFFLKRHIPAVQLPSLDLDSIIGEKIVSKIDGHVAGNDPCKTMNNCSRHTSVSDYSNSLPQITNTNRLKNLCKHK